MLGFSDFSFLLIWLCPKSCICACPKGTGPYLTNQKFKSKTLMTEREGEKEREREREREREEGGALGS